MLTLTWVNSLAQREACSRALAFSAVHAATGLHLDITSSYATMESHAATCVYN